MNTEYNNPGNAGDNSQWKKEQEMGSTPGSDTANKGLESRGPNKSKPFRVLNPDGSLADLPDENVPGKGALDGTVGLGT
ncbi:MAG: hypothetical protein JWO58_3374 [Chitinophagaceae bacterium]|nr:hypothetical protein [Chitinophagaceae bacterium]